MPQLQTPADQSSPARVIRTVLVVDERDSSRLLTKWFLGNFGYLVDSVRSADEAMALFELTLHDLVVTDRCVSERVGLEMAALVKRRSPSTPVILFSAKPPADPSDCDAFVARPAHLLLVKNAIDDLCRSLP